MVPEGINGAEVIARAFKRYNLALGAGLSKVAGKLFRIGHLGDLNELMLLGAIAGAEMAMLDVGVKIEPGSGVAAAQKYWRKPSPSRRQIGPRRMTLRVVFLDRASLKAKVRKPSCASEYVEHEKTAAEEIVPRLAGATVAIVNKVPMRAQTLAQLPQLKMIAVAATGYDVVDVRVLQGARHRGGQHPQLRDSHRAGTRFRDDSGAAPQSARLPPGCRERRLEQVRAILLFHARHRRSVRRHARHHRRGCDRPGNRGDRPRLRHAGAVRRPSAAEDGRRDVHSARPGARRIRRHFAALSAHARHAQSRSTWRRFAK